MESSLLFFLVGLSVYGVEKLMKDKAESMRLIAFVGAGLLSALVLGLLVGDSLFPWITLPAWWMPVMGGLAGLLMFGADRLRIVTRPGVRYIATLLLGAIMAGICYGLALLAGVELGLNLDPNTAGRIIPLTFVLVGFLTVFGYTFPARRFGRRQQNPEETRDRQ